MAPDADTDFVDRLGYAPLAKIVTFSSQPSAS